jgi:hypothetical protein
LTVGVTAVFAGASAANAPKADREFGQLVEVTPPDDVKVGMTRRAVERLLKEDPAWLREWPGSMGQSYAVYASAGLSVFYGSDGRVLRVEQRWKDVMTAGNLSTFVPGYIVVQGEGDW